MFFEIYLLFAPVTFVLYKNYVSCKKKWPRFLESIQNGVVDFNYFLLEKFNRYFARNICHGYYKISNKPI